MKKWFIKFTPFIENLLSLFLPLSIAVIVVGGAAVVAGIPGVMVILLAFGIATGILKSFLGIVMGIMAIVEKLLFENIPEHSQSLKSRIAKYFLLKYWLPVDRAEEVTGDSALANSLDLSGDLRFLRQRSERRYFHD